jgi:hypothetical protein
LEAVATVEIAPRGSDPRNRFFILTERSMGDLEASDAERRHLARHRSASRVDQPQVRDVWAIGGP